MSYKGTKVSSYFWKSLNCELCKESFEDKMKFMMFKILSFEIPRHKQFMILESVKSAPAKVIHVFDFGNCDGKDDKSELLLNEFRIGRSIESDMKIADISVSRIHSYI
jgi:hypothetical protein